ncbi:MAG: stage III sporulation protein AF [Caloramator sp.]|nr:stage III sporulation protein AF [Caloramator sp.]
MINFLKSWITTIVTLIIFLTLAELILPENSIKKYSKFVIGVIVILNILVPVFKLFDKSFNLEANLSVFEKKYEPILNNKENANQLQNKMKETTINEFKEKLKENIEKDVLKNTGKKISVKRIDVNTQFGSDAFGSINYIELKKEDSSDIKPVEKVVIGNNKSNSIYENKDKDIVNYITKSYRISEENIVFVK